MPHQEYEHTRFAVLSNISKPKSIEAKFVYNFFVPNERAAPGTSPQTFQVLGTEIDPSTGHKLILNTAGNPIDEFDMKLATPRWVEINWKPAEDTNSVLKEGVNIQMLDTQVPSYINRAEEMSSPIDLELKFLDLFMMKRLQIKLDLIASAYADTSADPVTKNTFLKHTLPQKWSLRRPAVFKQHNVDILNLNRPSGINVVASDTGAETFKEASALMTEMTVDRRIFWETVESDYTRNYFSRRKFIKWSEDDLVNLKDLPADGDPMLGQPVARTLAGDDLTKAAVSNEVFFPDGTAAESSAFAAGHITNLVGYIVERYSADQQVTDNEPEETIYVNSPNVNSMIDTNIRYGGAYFYSVRSVYERYFYGYDDASGEHLHQILFVSSHPADPVYIEAVERTPPAEPDGVFYKFNYVNKRGLMITWQYPVGKQRDTKYFQIFRRKSINDPFTCIAELDFNNANPKSEKRESVREDRVIKSTMTRTFYEDSDFTRQSEYIYAIAAVDAHGLTSGYSAQTYVKFNAGTNQLKLKSISRSGAPKQYPNFHVDPDMDENTFVHSLTQDAMLVSQGHSFLKKQIKIYFDPDTIKATNPGNHPGSWVGERQILRLSDSSQQSAEGPGGVYKLHLLNLDRQKSDTLEIRVKDYRGVDEIGGLHVETHV